MAEFAADRNLLFGILALQMDFVTREALIAAMNAWTLDKQRPLGEILVAQGALDPRDRALLEPMIERHVQRHDGDPAQSLAAVISATGPLDGLKSIGDDEVQASLGRSGTMIVKDPDSDRTSIFFGAPASSGGRFHIIRLHDQGGLGEVYVANDKELHREVALKQIKNFYADNPESRARFIVEAEITGGLEHPGIVPVYSLGHDPTGRPFYAMRFIRGESLKEAIRRFHDAQATRRGPFERSIEFRRLLGSFIDVCDAIAYAHSRGVLHRDLKPGNIVLGKYGETIVVDWGLAKPLGRREPSPAGDEATLKPSSGNAVGVTLPGRPLGTPGYMSPEQASGDLDHLGPPSDIYSLGATLYHVLTGRAPFAADHRDDRLRQNQRGEFTAACKSNPRVPRTLETICHKAMALRPDDRYSNVGELADDLERWLADEPVSGESLATRVRRWCRKNPTAASWLFAMLFVDMNLVIFSLQSLAQGSRTDPYEFYVGSIFYLGIVFQTWLFACFILSILDISFTWAGSGGSFRAIYKRLAWRNFRWTVKLNFFLSLVLLIVLLISKIVDNNVYQYEEHAPADIGPAPTNNNPGASRLDPAYHVVRGNAYAARGESSKAIEALKKATEGYAALAAARPGVPEYKAGLAGSYYTLGYVLQSMGEAERAAEAYRKAISIYKDAIRLRPEQPDFPSRLGAALNNYGLILASHGRHEEAVAGFREAIRYQRPLVERLPRVGQYRMLLSSHYYAVANSLIALGRGDAAADATRERIKLWPTNPGELYNGARSFVSILMTTQDGTRRRTLADEAMQSLRAAVAAGYGDGQQMARDPFLSPLHDRGDFQELAGELLDRTFPDDPFVR